jgi:hypothetical protein
MRYLAITALLTAALAGCADTGRDEVAFPFYVAGSDVSESIVATGDVSVSLERADLAFGPLYLCAGNQAGHLCDTARVEWIESVVVPGTNPEARPAGMLAGVSGSVKSWMYDLGFTSLLTQDEPLLMPAARELGDVSLRVEGSATVDGVVVPFEATVVVSQTSDTEQGVPVVRKNASETFAHDVTADEPGLLIRFDPAAWIRGVDFRAFFDDGACEACAEGLHIEPDTQAYRAIHNALVAGERPIFEWGFSP